MQPETETPGTSKLTPINPVDEQPVLTLFPDGMASSSHDVGVE